MPFVLLNNVYLIVMRSSLLAACLLAFCAVCLFQQCEYENIEDNYPPPPTSPCDSATVSYMSDIRPIIFQSCAINGCHASGGPQSELTTYEQVKFYVDNGLFKSWVIDQVPYAMPIGTPLTPEELQKIGTWLDEGACKN
jgi:hypothetical protein